MSSFDHPTLIQNISQSMATLRKSQTQAMQGFGQLAKTAMATVVAERRSIGRHMKEIFHACNLN